jgi:hypothetical protein
MTGSEPFQMTPKGTKLPYRALSARKVLTDHKDDRSIWPTRQAGSCLGRHELCLEIVQFDWWRTGARST